MNNREANKVLNIQFKGVKINNNFELKYLGVILDRSLTFKSHVQKPQEKLKTKSEHSTKISRNWMESGCYYPEAMVLVYATAEYAPPVWLNGTHSGKVETQLNSAMQS